jgi:small-conductance mechanosensitive channel
MYEWTEQEAAAAGSIPPPRLHAVEPVREDERVAALEGELAEERVAREAAEATSSQMAALLAKEHDRVRQLEDELALTRTQMRMVARYDEAALKQSRSLGERARRAIGR